MNKKSNKLHFNVGEYIEELEQINIRVNGKKVEKPGKEKVSSSNLDIGS